MYRKFTYTTLIILACHCTTAFSEDIYKAVDSKGITHYSSKPLVKGSAPAKLPEITRGEVKMPASQLISCKSHGGIDCQAGADSDGSVVCSDGFKESAQRFNFSCSAPKLEVADISDIEADGSFSVHIRNSKSVVAKKPLVLLRTDSGDQITIKGPSEIEGFGSGEFRFDPSVHSDGSKRGKAKATFSTKPGLEKVEISCGNCQ